MLIGIVVSLLCVVLLVKYLDFKKKYSDLNKLPGPTIYPIVGNALAFKNDSVGVYETILRFTKKYGTMYRYWIGMFQPTLVVAAPEHMEYFLGSSEHINKSPNYKLLQIWLGDGLILSNGDHWRNHRKLLTPTFHFKILDQFIPLFFKCSDVLIDKMKNKVNDNFDVFPLINLYSLDSICESAMGINIDAQNKEVSYVKSVKGFLKCHMERVFSIVKRNNFLAKFTDTYKEQQKHVKELKSFCEEAIKTRKSKLLLQSNESEVDSFGQKKKIALLDLLLDLEQKNLITNKDVREEVDNFMFAGHDTVSTTLSFALFQLSKNPEIQNILYEEIKSVVIDELTQTSLQDLKYTEAVIKETLRINTTVPFIERQLLKDITYEGLNIPAGTIILFDLHSLHQNETYFPEPNKFKPERFFSDAISKRHPYSFLPFSAGPRNCIGQKYAMLSMKTTLTKIISNFEILPVDGFVPLLGNNAILVSLNGVSIRVRQRQ